LTQQFTLLPYAVSSATRQAVPPFGEGRHLRINYHLQVTHQGSPQGAPVNMSTELKGPGDIIGIDRNIITRVEPKPGLRGFEPNYFPLVEFDDVDFPWRYSLHSSTSKGRMPWIALIVLEADEFSFYNTERAPLPVIEVKNPALSLPPPSQLWAFAHVHLDDFSGNVDQIEAKVNSDDSQTFSRLICPRKLRPLKSYYGFLVPTYEAGRLAGLGQKQDNIMASDFNNPAWSHTSTSPVRLPVYYQWQFTTDAMEDLESLLRRLKSFDAEALEDKVKPDMVSAAEPGYYEGYRKPSAIFTQQTALQVPQTERWSYDSDPVLSNKMIQTLEEVIEGEIDNPDDEDPLVAFPPYGFRYPEDPELSVSQAESGEWFSQLNLDLKFRESANVGADLVRKNKDQFSHIAWLQYDKIVEANQELMRLELSKVISERLVDRHLGALRPETALMLAEPMTGFTEISKGKTVASYLSEKGEPLSYTSRALRHQSAKRTTVTKTIIQDKLPGDKSKIAVHVHSEPIPVPGHKSRMPTRRLSTPSLNRPVLADAHKNLSVSNSAIKDISGFGIAENIAQLIDLDRQVAKLEPSDIILTKGVAPVVSKVLEPFLTEDSLQAVRPANPVITQNEYSAQTLIDPIAKTLKHLPAIKARFAITGLTEVEQETPRTIWRSPEISLPVYNYLRDCAQDFLLAGFDNIPDNSVVIMEENRQFIEALMVGMNHEMNSSLRFAEYPLDLAGTIFKRFWNRGADIEDTVTDDIAPIHKWRNQLGKNVPENSPNSEENFVILIKGDIVRKLGDPIVEINISETDNKFIAGKGESIAPSFVGKVNRDTYFYGFEFSIEELQSIKDRVYFVIYEPIGQLRFGLDIATAAIRQERFVKHSHSIGFEAVGFPPLHSRAASQQRLSNISAPPSSSVSNSDDLSWSHIEPLHDSAYVNFSKTVPSLAAWTNNKNSASMARSFWQKPIAGILPFARVF